MNTYEFIKKIDDIKDALTAIQIKKEKNPDEEVGKLIVKIKEEIDEILSTITP